MCYLHAWRVLAERVLGGVGKCDLVIGTYGWCYRDAWWGLPEYMTDSIETCGECYRDLWRTVTGHLSVEQKPILWHDSDFQSIARK